MNPSAAKKVEDSAPKEWVIQAACLKLKGDRVCCENIAGGNVYNCERDEGRPLVTVLQEMVANQCMLLCLKDKVVSDIPKRRCKSSGNCTRDDRKGTIDEASKTV